MNGPQVVYLHGLGSSPAAWKALLLGAAMAERGRRGALHCPALSHVPTEAVASAEAVIARLKGPVTLVGSSLGGFYATYLAEKHDLRAVLVNPAVLEPLDPGKWVGTHSSWHEGTSFELTGEHVGQLRGYEVAAVTPERYLLMVETGDQVLDCRHALARYAGCRRIVVRGGEHRFASFPEHLPQVLAFCGI